MYDYEEVTIRRCEESARKREEERIDFFNHEARNLYRITIEMEEKIEKMKNCYNCKQKIFVENIGLCCGEKNIPNEKLVCNQWVWDVIKPIPKGAVSE